MNDLTTRLNQELSDRYRIEREIGKGGEFSFALIIGFDLKR